MQMKFLSFVVLALSLCVSAAAQVVKDDPFKIQPTLDALAEIDVANQILPLLLSKDQLRKLLPVVEQCRKYVRDQEKKEADRIKGLKPEADRFLGEAVKGLLPTQAFLDKVNALFKTFETERKGVLAANTLIITSWVRENFNPGQKKAAIGVTDKIFDANSKTWTDGTPDQKLQYFAVAVLLNDHAYDFLAKLSKGS